MKAGFTDRSTGAARRTCGQAVLFSEIGVFLSDGGQVDAGMLFNAFSAGAQYTGNGNSSSTLRAFVHGISLSFRAFGVLVFGFMETVMLLGLNYPSL
jgi:hypothetical protein